MKGKNLLIVVVIVTVAVAGALLVSAQDDGDCDFGFMFDRRGRGMGMMGRGFPEDCADAGMFGMGMMGGMMHDHMMRGFGSMQFGPSTDMMGAWDPPSGLAPSGESLTLDGAVEVAEAYIAAWDTETALELGEVMQFSNHFYAQAVEAETGRSAFEFLIDPTTGIVIGEPGPNMMWNLRYGMMTRGMGMFRPSEDDTEMTITAAEAQELAQAYLDEVLSDTQASEEADAFYGYYTLHVLRDGATIGMLSVNGYNGQVWLHHWHGDFIAMTEHDHE